MERERRGKGKERKEKKRRRVWEFLEERGIWGVGLVGKVEERKRGGEQEQKREQETVCVRERWENGLLQMMFEEIGRNADQQEHLADGLVHDCILRQLLQLPQHQLRLVFVLQRSQCVRVLVDGAMTI